MAKRRIIKKAKGGSVNENIDVFGYQTKYFHLSEAKNGATPLFKGMIRDMQSDTKERKDGLKEAARHLDNFFAVQAGITEPNGVTESKFHNAVDELLLAQAAFSHQGFSQVFDFAALNLLAIAKELSPPKFEKGGEISDDKLRKEFCEEVLHRYVTQFTPSEREQFEQWKKDKAEKENIYIATVQIAVVCEKTEGYAEDAVSFALSEIAQHQEGAILDWQYAKDPKTRNSMMPELAEGVSVNGYEEGDAFIEKKNPKYKNRVVKKKKK